jgi:hypothetical protein
MPLLINMNDLAPCCYTDLLWWVLGTFVTTSRPALGYTQPPTNWYQRYSSPHPDRRWGTPSLYPIGTKDARLHIQTGAGYTPNLYPIGTTDTRLYIQTGAGVHPVSIQLVPKILVSISRPSLGHIHPPFKGCNGHFPHGKAAGVGCWQLFRLVLSYGCVEFCLCIFKTWCLIKHRQRQLYLPHIFQLTFHCYLNITAVYLNPAKNVPYSWRWKEQTATKRKPKST